MAFVHGRSCGDFSQQDLKNAMESFPSSLPVWLRSGRETVHALHVSTEGVRGLYLSLIGHRASQESKRGVLSLCVWGERDTKVPIPPVQSFGPCSKRRKQTR